MSAVDRQYEDLLARIMREGTPKGDRTGTGTRSLFGAQLRYDLSKGFPLITTKRVHLKSVVGELLWFLSGSSNVSWLQDNGIRIWNEWADEDGELGPVYGVQWRSWNAGDGRHIDQISQVLETLKTNPDSRRMVVSAWNVGDLPEMALEPCHAFFQLCGRRPPVAAALPAQRGHVPGRALQHRVLLAAHPHVRPAGGP